MKLVLSRSGLVGVVVACSPALAGDVSPVLDAVFTEVGPDKVVSSLVYMSDRVDIAALNEQLNRQHADRRVRHETVVRALQERAAIAQAGLIAHLDELQAAGRIASYEAIWISNAVRVDAVQAELEQLADRLDEAGGATQAQIELNKRREAEVTPYHLLQCAAYSCKSCVARWKTRRWRTRASWSHCARSTTTPSSR